MHLISSTSPRKHVAMAIGRKGPLPGSPGSSPRPPRRRVRARPAANEFTMRTAPLRVACANGMTGRNNRCTSCDRQRGQVPTPRSWSAPGEPLLRCMSFVLSDGCAEVLGEELTALWEGSFGLRFKATHTAALTFRCPLYTTTSGPPASALRPISASRAQNSFGARDALHHSLGGFFSREFK